VAEVTLSSSFARGTWLRGGAHQVKAIPLDNAVCSSQLLKRSKRWPAVNIRPCLVMKKDGQGNGCVRSLHLAYVCLPLYSQLTAAWRPSADLSFLARSQKSKQ